jgi:hypothetical protein
MEVSGQFHTLATLSSRKNPQYHYIGGWVSPKASLDMVMKRKYPFFPPLEI